MDEGRKRKGGVKDDAKVLGLSTSLRLELPSVKMGRLGGDQSSITSAGYLQVETLRGESAKSSKEKDLHWRYTSAGLGGKTVAGAVRASEPPEGVASGTVGLGQVRDGGVLLLRPPSVLTLVVVARFVFLGIPGVSLRSYLPSTFSLERVFPGVCFLPLKELG